MDTAVNGMCDESFQQLFLDFSMPLALLQPVTGECYFNHHYLAHLSESLMAEAVVWQYATQGSAAPLSLTCDMPRGASAELELTFYRIELHHFVLLLIDRGGVQPLDKRPDAELIELTELAPLTVVDSAGGVGNRLPLLKHAQLEMARSKRYQQPLSLIFLAFDNGPLPAEPLVSALLSLSRAKLRNTDMLFRCSENGFVVLTPACDSNAAVSLAEKLREVVAEQLTVTISLGVAEYRSGDDFNAWQSRAVVAQAEAVALGGNRSHAGAGAVADLWRADGSGSVNGLIWYKNYQSGDSTIDAQHKLLFELANELIRMASHNVDKMVWQAKLDSMMEYVAKHFRDEEAILQVQGYQDLAEHKRIHASLLADVVSLKAEVLAETLPVNRLFEFVVNDVVAKHVLGADRDYFELLNHTKRK